MIRITDRISIEERELEERFVRASGPGGQNVNKLSSAVQLRFDVRGSPSLATDVRLRLERLAGRRLTPVATTAARGGSHHAVCSSLWGARTVPSALTWPFRRPCAAPHHVQAPVGVRRPFSGFADLIRDRRVSRPAGIPSPLRRDWRP